MLRIRSPCFWKKKEFTFDFLQEIYIFLFQRSSMISISIMHLSSSQFPWKSPVQPWEDGSSCKVHCGKNLNAASRLTTIHSVRFSTKGGTPSDSLFNWECVPLLYIFNTWFSFRTNWITSSIHTHTHTHTSLGFCVLFLQRRVSFQQKRRASPVSKDKSHTQTSVTKGIWLQLQIFKLIERN